MDADGIPHNKLCAAAGPACVDLGARVERVAVQRDGIVKVGDGAVQRGQQAAVDRVEVFAHFPIQLSAVGQGEAAQRGKDQGRGDKNTDMGRAVCAGQGQGAGDGDRAGSLGVQGQRVAENAVPPGIGRIVTGNALQYIRRQGHGTGGRCAEHHLPPRGVDEQKALDVGHRAHRVELGGHCRVHRQRLAAGGVAGQQVGAHAGVVGAPACQVVDLIHVPADGRCRGLQGVLGIQDRRALPLGSHLVHIAGGDDQGRAQRKEDRQRQHPGNQLCGGPGGRAGLLLQAQRDHHVSRRLVRRQALHLLHQGLKVLPAGQHGVEEQKSRTIGPDGAVGKALDVAEQTLQGLCRDGNLRVQVLQQLPQGGAGPMEGLRLPDAPGL